LHARATDRSSNGRRTDAFARHYTDLIAVKPTLTFSIDTLTLRLLDDLALALFDEAPLPLGGHAANSPTGPQRDNCTERPDRWQGPTTCQ
jgi:hypothetical protein